MRILVVEDFAPMRMALAQGLGERGYAVDAAGDGEQGWFLATANAYDLIILDVMLPIIDGLEILRRLRARGSTAPVLLLTARDGLDDRVLGLDAGADDYLVKPFAVQELLARVRALVRRGQRDRAPVLAIGDLEIDTNAKQVRRGGRAVELAPREYALLEVLARNAGRVVSRDEIAASLYAFSDETSSNVIEAAVARLRKRLWPEGEAALLHTRRGFGYQLGGDEA